MAYVLPGERHCWVNHQAFPTSRTLLSILYKRGLFSWKVRCFSPGQHTRHAGSSFSEAHEQLWPFSGNAAHLALQVISVADGLTETSGKQVIVPFAGVNEAQWQAVLETKLSLLVCCPCTLASGYWASCFLCPCHPRAFLFHGTAAEQWPDKLQKHLLTCGSCAWGNSQDLSLRGLQ